jgi:hypothetical protein
MNKSKEDVIKSVEGLIKKFEDTQKEAEDLINRFRKILTDGCEEDGTPLSEESRKIFQNSINSLKDL